MIKFEEFLALPVEDVARLVRQSGPRVCVFPINGTRRWFLLEHAQKASGDPVENYIKISIESHISLYRLFFNHGIDTLLTPTLGSDILLRGNNYMSQIGADGYERLAHGEDFLRFYNEYDVRVRFYGDYRKALANTEYDYLSRLFDEVAQKTRHHNRYRLFFGAFASDATETIAELSVRYYQENGKVPNKHDLIEMYYSEYVEPVSLFIGFDKLSTFDYPLLTTGEEDLYFTIAPSPYLAEKQFRAILYDHLYTRHQPEPVYQQLPEKDLADLRKFYHDNQDNIIGVGKLCHQIWIPRLDPLEN